MSDAGTPLPDFETGFIPWDEYSSYFESVLVPEPGLDQPVDFQLSPDGSSSGSDPTCYHAGLDTPSHWLNRDYSSPEINSPSAKPVSGSDEPVPEPTEEQVRPVSIMEERKRKRKLSNRESARRSRMRKRTELENIRGELNRLKIENRHWGNQLRFVNHHLQTALMDNNRLRVESLVLQTKLTEIAQIFHFQATQESYAYLQ